MAGGDLAVLTHLHFVTCSVGTWAMTQYNWKMAM